MSHGYDARKYRPTGARDVELMDQPGNVEHREQSSRNDEERTGKTARERRHVGLILGAATGTGP